jgi:L-alanine-DL-glutamate epimerase-like enolase superfamily enzyme
MNTSKLTRRNALKAVAGSAGLLLVSPGRLIAEAAEEPLFRLRERFPSPVKIASVELLRRDQYDFVRVTSSDGATGTVLASERMAYLHPIFLQRVAPYFVGKDARDLESLVDGVYVHQSNYKLAGLALWVCVGCLEFAILDLLGKSAGKSIGELMGGVVRREIPIYLSSMRRDTTPEQEVAWLSEQLTETGAKAVKLKIGGRMSRNADASPGRTERLVPLARKTFGDSLTLQVDANGSYDAAKAIEVGRMLQDHGVYFFEEPCPWEDFEATKQVADALDIPVAGGEQDSSFAKFRWMVRNHAVDIVQPDVIYNGGLIRTSRVARLAAAATMDITPHAPQPGYHAAYMLHFASVTPNLGRFQEYPAARFEQPSWYGPQIQVRNGAVRVPNGPGIGITIDAKFLEKAESLGRC